MAAMILSMGVMVGTGMAWCLKKNVSVGCSSPVSAMIMQMLFEGRPYVPTVGRMKTPGLFDNMVLGGQGLWCLGTPWGWH